MEEQLKELGPIKYCYDCIEILDYYHGKLREKEFDLYFCKNCNVYYGLSSYFNPRLHDDGELIKLEEDNLESIADAKFFTLDGKKIDLRLDDIFGED